MNPTSASGGLTTHPEQAGASTSSPAMAVNPAAQQQIQQQTQQQTQAPFQSLLDSHAHLQAMKGHIESVSETKSGRHTNHKSETDEVISQTVATPAEHTTESVKSSDLASVTPAASPNLPHTPATGDKNMAPNGLPQFHPSAEHIADQVVEGTTYGIKNGQKELVIRLNPDNLGEVRVNLLSHGRDQVSARLIASTPESMNTLKDQIQHLKTSLESQGIQVDRLSVVLAGSTEAHSHFGNQQHDNPQQFFQQSGQHHHQSSNPGNFNQQQHQQPGAFAQMMGQGGQQHKPGYAQHPGQFNGSAAGSGATESNGVDNPRRDGRPQGNDNGRISLLA
jgi:flagellar hook-length control protein FliK